MRLASSFAAAFAACAVPAAAQPPTPSAPAAAAIAPLPPAHAALGRRLAELGDFNAILGTMGNAQIEAMAANTPDLSAPERARLRRVGQEVLAAGRARILTVVGDVYARHFTAAQLRAIITFLESPAGRAYVGALPQLLPQIAGAAQGMDLDQEVRAAFCRETGKLCQAE